MSPTRNRLAPFASRLVSPETFDTDILRLAISGICFAHGSWRFYTHEVGGLADLIASRHLPFATVVAYAITLNETVGSLLLAARVLVWPVSLGMICVFFSGILMFNIHRGFFIIGAGEGGWEYNGLLIVCAGVNMWRNRGHRIW